MLILTLRNFTNGPCRLFPSSVERGMTPTPNNQMRKTTTLVLIILVQVAHLSLAQSHLNFDSLIITSATTFKGGKQFDGKGWDQLVERAQHTNYVLIGEDHFIEEIPVFTQALMQQLKVDNYICEIDQWMANILVKRINTLTGPQLDKWISDNYNGFSFFQKKNEFELMRYLVKQKINVIGIEQVGLMSTTIIFQYLTETGAQKNRRLYEIMRDSSAVSNDKFFKDQSKPFFLSTVFFASTIEKLDKSSMKPDESELVGALVRSADIYKTGSHRNRIKLMQSNLMENYPQPLKGEKNLFKFGANHSMKGESYLPVYDIGTTAHVLAQSENQDSYHILILPKAGNQAGFLNGVNAVDLADEPYKSLKTLFDRSSDSEWTFIDLEKIRSILRKWDYTTGSPFLEKTIYGYDALVVIPHSTAADAIR